MCANDLQIVEPAKIGPYILRGTVGDGAFSIVKLVYHETTHQFFACKIVPRSRINTESLQIRFEIEIRINQQMHHPGIVQLFDLLKDENNYYVIMEFCPNGELFQYIVDRNHLSEDEAKRLVRQILETLQYIHNTGVSHRDLKPENLLIDQEGRVKFSDFGLSRFIPKNGLVNTPCGSPCYASPECISGKPYNGRTTDVWSVGVILYAMLTGQLPWTKRNQTQLFAQIKRGEYQIPTFLSEDCRNFITGLMTVDINKRLTIEDALKHSWLADTNSVFDGSNNNIGCVSLRTVDKYFCRELTDDELSQLGLIKTASSENFSITSTLKYIIDGSNLPIIRNTKDANKSHDYPIPDISKPQPHKRTMPRPQYSKGSIGNSISSTLRSSTALRTVTASGSRKTPVQKSPQQQQTTLIRKSVVAKPQVGKKSVVHK